MTEDQRLLSMACNEITQLRRANEILGAKVEVMELFGLTLRTQPNYGNQAMTEDIVWRMQRRIEEIESGLRPLSDSNK